MIAVPRYPRTMRWLAVFALLTACGGAQKGPRTGDSNNLAPTPEPDGGAAVDPESPVSAVECGKLTEHVVELYLVEMRATRPPEEMPTDDQVAEVRKTLETALLDKCMTFPRAVLECGLAATKFVAIADCEKTSPEGPDKVAPESGE